MDAKILQDGPFSDEINEANQTITHNLRLLAATEGEATDAMAARDVDALVRLRAKREALASVVAAMRVDRDSLSAKRLAQIVQEAADRREAAFASRPAQETYSDPTDPNTTITRLRFFV